MGKKLIETQVDIDTGDIWVCPTCEKRFRLIHREYERDDGTHVETHILDEEGSE